MKIDGHGRDGKAESSGPAEQHYEYGLLLLRPGVVPAQQTRRPLHHTAATTGGTHTSESHQQKSRQPANQPARQRKTPTATTPVSRRPCPPPLDSPSANTALRPTGTPSSKGGGVRRPASDSRAAHARPPNRAPPVTPAFHPPAQTSIAKPTAPAQCQRCMSAARRSPPTFQRRPRPAQQNRTPRANYSTRLARPPTSHAVHVPPAWVSLPLSATPCHSLPRPIAAIALSCIASPARIAHSHHQLYVPPDGPPLPFETPCVRPASLDRPRRV